MEAYRKWLEEQIECCLNDKDLQREHWAFCKAYEKLTALQHQSVSEQNEQSDTVARFYLVSFGGEGRGSIWFKYHGFPSRLWIKEQIMKKFVLGEAPVIMHIQELSENDYIAFNKQ